MDNILAGLPVLVTGRSVAFRTSLGRRASFAPKAAYHFSQLHLLINIYAILENVGLAVETSMTISRFLISQNNWSGRNIHWKITFAIIIMKEI